MPRLPLHHIIRVRQSDELTFLRPGIMDELIINANQLENSPDSTATALRRSTLPFSIDPVLTRFQMPGWWINEKGEEKRSYRRLGNTYVRGTKIRLPAGPLVHTVLLAREWRILASNVIEYQRNRLNQIRPQLDFFDSEPELRPKRLMAPALVAYSKAEDDVNRLLSEASAEAATMPIAVPVIVPADRLLDAHELNRLLASVLSDRVSSYFIWTPEVTEELLLADPDVFTAVLRLISALADRGIPVGHLHATYSIAALHDVGISAVVHHLGWVDKAEPVGQRAGGPRSCQTYVPGVRHAVRFDRAHALGRSLDARAYTARYCNCTFCAGAFEGGSHPLDLLLEDQLVGGQGRRRTPTGRAVSLNTWHFLLARSQDVQAFSERPGVDVLEEDIQRAALLAGARDTDRLRRLANQLHSA